MYKAVPRKPRKLKNNYKELREKAIEHKNFKLFSHIVLLIILENFAKEGILKALEKGNSYVKRKKKRNYNRY